jgi:hypothetical protein
MVVTEDLLLSLLDSGHSLPWIRAISGWPSRHVRQFARHHGYLFAAGGAPYQLTHPSPGDAKS